MNDSTPVVTVLCGSAGDRPTGLDSFTGRLDFRFTDADGLGDALDGAAVLLLWDFFSSAVEEVWDRCAGLRWIHVVAAGVDTLLFPELRDSAVTVTNARGTFDRPIAEFVLATIAAHAKLLHQSRDLQRNHHWEHRETTSLLGARTLVVGTGAIAGEIARLLQAVGLEVRGAGRRPRLDDPTFGVIVDSADLPNEVGWADYVVNATPLTAATTGLFDAATFVAMKPTAHLINIGRGPSVVEADLLAALKAGELDGASLDVFETEPLEPDSPLWEAPGMVISAHMSGDVTGWKDTLSAQFADNAERWLAGKPLVNVVDKALGYVKGPQ